MIEYVEKMLKEKRSEIELNEEAMSLFLEAMEEVEIKTFPVLKGTKITIRTPEQQKALEKILKKIRLRTAEKDNVSKHFTINFHDKLEEAEDQLDVKTAGIALTLSLYLDKQSDGVLKINGEIMTKQDIDAILGMDDETCKKELDILKEKGILFYKRERIEVMELRGKNKGKMKIVTANVYRMNPRHHCMGYLLEDTKDVSFTKVFKEAAKEYLEYISIEARGLLYKMLRFVHFQSYYLVMEPNRDLRNDKEKTFYENIQDEKIRKNILAKQQDINMDDLVQLSGKSRRTVERYIKEWEYARIVLKNGRGKKSCFLMNPKLFTRQEIHCPYAVTSIFHFDKVQPQKAPHTKKRKRKK